MTTTSSKSANQADAAAKSLRDTGEQVLDFSRKTSASVLGAYESTLSTIADYQDKLADSSTSEWMTSIGHAQAELTRGFARAYGSTARELLK